MGKMWWLALSSVTMSETTSTAVPTLRDLTSEFLTIESGIKLGGGVKAIERQHSKDRLTARERIDLLVDPGSVFQELGLWSAYNMYMEAGGAPGLGW